MVTVHFNKTTGKKIFTSGSALLMLIPKSKKWFTKNKRTLYVLLRFIFNSLDFTPIAAFAIVSCKIPATFFRMYKGEERLFVGVTVYARGGQTCSMYGAAYRKSQAAKSRNIKV